MYWRLQSLPELQHLSEKERTHLVRSAGGRFFAIKLLGRSALIGYVLTLALLFYADQLISNFLTTSQLPGYFGLVIFLSWGSVATIGVYQFNMTRIRGQMRLYIAELRSLGVQVPVCLKCGYAVEDSSGNCPECGTAL